jgi:serine/threonine protein kinase/tetratricopeptide (TPR) repeat protein
VEAVQLSAGAVLDGRYRIERPLGRGGMGEVYAARRLALGDLVAVKRLLPERDSPELRARFLGEARAAAHIRHPNVVRVFDFGEGEGASPPYIVMEYLEGPTLAEVIARHGRLRPDRALAVLTELCAAVEAGHRRGIVHRDLKPANVLLAASDDGGEVVKVTDFGIAFDLGRSGERVTSPGLMMGTFHYMAPEQIEGRTPSPASDVFSLGVMLYEMLLGRPPFEAAPGASVVMAVLKGRYLAPEVADPALPPALCAAVGAALVPAPGDRPSADELARMAAGLPRGHTAPRARVLTPAPISSPTPAPVATPTPTPGRPASHDSTAMAHQPARATDTSPAFARFIGREAELARLREELDASLPGRGRLALVSGDVGAGKSRLFERFAEIARGQGALVLEGRFYDYAGSRPPPLATFAGMLGGAGLDETLERGGDRGRLLAAVADEIAGRAGTRPLVLLCDDVQFATQLELEVLEHLGRRLAARGVLLVVGLVRGAGGPELAAWRARNPASAEIVLEPLGEAEVRAWLDGVFGGLRIAAPDVRRLGRVTGGNLHALAEVVRHLVARGVIARDDHGAEHAGWRCASLDAVPLPDSVAQVVRARLADVPGEARRLLDLAAVLGDELRVATLAAAAGASEDDVDAVLESAPVRRFLTDRGVSPGNDVRFKSPLWREVLYAELPARQRRRAHRAVVDALERVYRGQLERMAPVLCDHHHAMGAWPEALAWGLAAAEDALARQDHDTAAAALARAADALVQADAAGLATAAEPRARLDLLAGRLAVQHGRFDEAEPRLARAAAAADAAALPALHADAELALARAAFGRGDYALAGARAEAAAARAEAAGRRERMLDARLLGIEAALRAGAEVVPSVDALLAGLGAADGGLVRARALRLRGWALLKRGAWAEASRDAEEALTLARTGRDPALELLAIAVLSAVRAESGDAHGAVELESKVLELARRLADRRREGIALANLGEDHVMAGDLERAAEHLRAGLAIFVDIGDRACEGDCRVNLGRVLLSRGEHEAAMVALERGIELCEATSRREYAAVGRVALGEARLLRGDVAGAREAFAHAAEVLAAMSSHLRWQAELGAARAARAAGDAAAARARAVTARALVEAQRAALPAGRDAGAFVRALAAIDELLREIG